jgi:hypothetical protein
MKYVLKITFLLTVSAAWMLQLSYAQSHSTGTDHSDHSITIIAEDYAFEAPNEILQGWTTIQFENHGEEPHFLLVSKVPEGKNLDDYTKLAMIFNDAWYSLRDDGIDHEKAYEMIGANLPEWFGGLQFVGGSGIIEAGAKTEVTLNLTPGTHILECYFKNEEGELHSMEGMLRELTVTDSPSDAAAPEADINITLSNFEMDIKGDLKHGKHTFSVHLVENPEQGFGHTVHVVRVDNDAEVDEVLRWFNFMEVDGLRTPSPYTFAGGMHLMPAGETAYFTTELEPGRYLFLSEYTGHLGVVQDVTVE